MNLAKAAGDSETSRHWSRIRLVLFLLVGLCICIAAGVYLYGKWQERQESVRTAEQERVRSAELKADRETARKLVPLTEVEIVERKLLHESEPAYDTGLGAKRIFVRGRVRNKSTQYELSAIQVELRSRHEITFPL